MTATAAPPLKPEHSDSEHSPAPAETTGQELDPRSCDPTQGRQIGFAPYDDPTKGRAIGSHPYDDPTPRTTNRL